MVIPARIIKKGKAHGEALVSGEPLSFFGCIDPDTGIVTEKGHELYGKSIKNKILIFPYGKGSTVGSYALYRMKKNNVSPLAIINSECEPIVAVGVIISDIPCLDHVKLEKFKSGDDVIIDSDKIIIKNKKQKH